MPIMATSSDGPAAREFRSISNRFIEVMKRGIAGFTEPAEIKIDDDRKLAIVWDEQDSANFSAYDLRLSCSCALCVSEDTGQRILNPKTIPLDIRITSIQRVGRYAVSISFSDGHETGIFRFDRLRTLEKKQQDSSRQSFNV